MILQALKEYYDRKAADPESGIAPLGFEHKELPFVIVIGADGRFVNLEDTRGAKERRMVGHVYLVPRSRTRTGPKSHQTTFLLWDHSGYLLDHPADNDRAHLQHQSWLASLATLPESLKADAGVAAVLMFYAKGGVTAVKAAPNWKDCADLPTCNMTFRLAGDAEPVPCRETVRNHVRQTVQVSRDEDDEADVKTVIGRCLVTGDREEIARVHGRTPISKDSKSLVGIQTNCGYDSYGKQRGYNAPVGKTAEFAYVTALNALLKSNRSRMKVGDVTTVFWAAKHTDTGFEDIFGDLWTDDPDRSTEAVRSLFKSPQTGAFVTDDDTTRFYVLGLAPNVARIAVRFWIADTVAHMAARIRQHFEDTTIVHRTGDQETLSLDRLLRSTALQEDRENIPPNLGGDTMRAILEELPYPQTLLQAVIRRVRAEQSKKDKRTGTSVSNVSYPRAALIKACVNRETRRNKNNKEEELTVSLDETNTNIGYRLGRLFAALEKIQQDAHSGINATIRDKFYGAASSTPVTVFGNLMRLSNHHLSKLERDKPGLAVVRKQLVQDIMCGVPDFPAHLALADQGRFAIGYYHQTQRFFEKKADAATSKEEQQ
jgi:CRISPR-associated protein Csd1